MNLVWSNLLLSSSSSSWFISFRILRVGNIEENREFQVIVRFLVKGNKYKFTYTVHIFHTRRTLSLSLSFDSISAVKWESVRKMWKKHKFIFADYVYPFIRITYWPQTSCISGRYLLRHSFKFVEFEMFCFKVYSFRLKTKSVQNFTPDLQKCSYQKFINLCQTVTSDFGYFTCLQWKEFSFYGRDVSLLELCAHSAFIKMAFNSCSFRFKLWV